MTLPHFSALGAVLILTSLTHAQVVRSGAGTNAASIQATVDTFRADLGAMNPNVAGSFNSGRREINWDGVPDASASPNSFPVDFFNVKSPRGVVYTTPGTGFQVSSSASSGVPVHFGNIDPSYSTFFEPFSSQRLFTSLGSNVTDVNFFIPGSTMPALTTGFGSVFSDVDLANTTSLQFFNAANISLGTFFVPNVPGANESFSFLGVSFSEAIVSRVRITSGNSALAPGNSTSDVVVMDDFVYGEPRLAARIPDAGSTFIFLGFSVGLMLFAARFRTIQPVRAVNR